MTIGVHRVRRALCALFVFISASSQSLADSIVIPDPPQLAAKAWVLMDFDSGRVLAEHNSHAQVEPASLTKIMTGYIVFRELAAKRMSMDEMATISKEAWQQPGSRSFMNVGSQVPVSTLVNGMIIQSGNDSSVALAEKVAGSSQVFAQLMNEHAQRLGMKNTHFVNPTGLPDPAHYTTAQDMASVAAAVIREYPDYYKIYAQKEFTWNNIRQQNRNRLLWQDESVDGMKTGHTESAGYCLVASAKRNNMRLISVILGADSEKTRAQETQKLLNYGFRFYETHQLYQEGQALQTIPVWQGALNEVKAGTSSGLTLTIPRGQYDKLKPSIEFQSELIAPISKGQTIGTLKVMLNEQVVGQMPLVALEEVTEGGFIKRAMDQAKLLFKQMTQ